MRGLKPRKLSNDYKSFYVASFTDAWIETALTAPQQGIAPVASFTDAWIETKIEKPDEQQNISRIFYRCVDWNYSVYNTTDKAIVASFTDAWIETLPKK